MIFSSPQISLATTNDIPALTALLNSAYRGESSKQGWTSEAHLIGGEIRTTPHGLLYVMQMPGSAIIKYEDVPGKITGCVNLQQHDNKIYLGMLSVSPQLQGAGIGKQLLLAAEEYANSHACSFIYMTVISVRTELINWYKRNGYYETGEKKPFKEDGTSGKHLQPLEFTVLEKKLPATS